MNRQNWSFRLSSKPREEWKRERRLDIIAQDYSLPKPKPKLKKIKKKRKNKQNRIAPQKQFLTVINELNQKERVNQNWFIKFPNLSRDDLFQTDNVANISMLSFASNSARKFYEESVNKESSLFRPNENAEVVEDDENDINDGYKIYENDYEENENDVIQEYDDDDQDIEIEDGKNTNLTFVIKDNTITSRIKLDEMNTIGIANNASQLRDSASSSDEVIHEAKEMKEVKNEIYTPSISTLNNEVRYFKCE